MEAIADVVKNILTCDFRRLPVEVLAHHFIGMFLQEHIGMKTYYDCISRNKALAACRKCNKNLKAVCPVRFGSNSMKSENCMAALLPHSFPEIANKWNISSQGVAANIKKTMDTYAKCVQPCKEKTVLCVPRLEKVCRAADIRAIKPVRFPMESGRIVANLLPRVKLVHNLRDPRGVVHSRLHTSESFQSLYAKTKANKIDIVKESVLFCRNAAKDIRIRKEIEETNRDSTLQVVYEHLADQPLSEASRIYSFIRKSMPNNVKLWLVNNTSQATGKQTQRISKVTMKKWQYNLTVAKMNEIDQFCRELYAESGHPWLFS